VVVGAVEQTMTEEEEQKEGAPSERVRFMCQIYGDSAENLGKGFPGDEELMKGHEKRHWKSQ
jgi:hypothetical protein